MGLLLMMLPGCSFVFVDHSLELENHAPVCVGVEAAFEVGK